MVRGVTLTMTAAVAVATTIETVTGLAPLMFTATALDMPASISSFAGNHPSC